MSQLHIDLIEIRGASRKQAAWEWFKKFHYMNTDLNLAARTFLAKVDGKIVGFCASLPLPSGTLRNACRAHKTVVLLPKEHPQQKRLWAMVADVQAAMYVSQGKRFYSQAPIEYGAYREEVESNWQPTTKNAKLRAKGQCNHEYMGNEWFKSSSPLQPLAPSL